jgi:FkbH-like protein
MSGDAAVLQRLVADGRMVEAWTRLYQQASSAPDYRTLRALCHARRKLAVHGPPPGAGEPVRVALLGGATTAMIREPLELALEAVGVPCSIHESPYNAFAHEMLDPASETVAFRPRVALVVATPANVATWPSWHATPAEVAAAVDEVREYWLGMCRALHQQTGCDIVLGNFHPLALRPLGAAGVKLPGEPNRFLRAVNEALAQHAPPYVHIHDVATLAAFHGVDHWFDPSLWYHAKQPVSFECLVPYVRSLAQLTGALLGKAAKCVVVDLDNTLWGGIVGDDGPEGLALGEGDAVGEAYTAFQRYLLRLKERGVMLAVVSKNEESAALAPFKTRPEMVLKRDDFAAFVANWQPKSENLRAIATTLNIGLDAMVLVDDNPAEREEVRQALPELRVVELGEDPAYFPMELDRSGWLGIVALSTEDRGRSGMYRADAARSELQGAVGDYGAFLRSLDQRAMIRPFEEGQLDRIWQLTAKTNQFNLTTRRLSRAELAAMMTSPHHLTASVRLADRFGDNGLISVFAARADGPELWIELWLMSCRVFNRGVEQLLCTHVVERARAAGYRVLHGLYVPTERNALVKDHYSSLGFTAAVACDGAEHWTLVPEAYRPQVTAITVVDDSGEEQPGGRRQRRGDHETRRAAHDGLERHAGQDGPGHEPRQE